MLFNEPKLPKFTVVDDSERIVYVLVLFNEPKLPKFSCHDRGDFETWFQCSSTSRNCRNQVGASHTLLRMQKFQCSSTSRNCRNAGDCSFDIELCTFQCSSTSRNCRNDSWQRVANWCEHGFSALQRAEIAEIHPRCALSLAQPRFQCSSTSRNCRNYLTLKTTMKA